MVVPIFVKRIPEIRKGCHHHIIVPQWLRRLTILTTNTMTPKSFSRLCPALPWSPKFVELCIVNLSMSELSGFADASNNSDRIVSYPRFYVHLRWASETTDQSLSSGVVYSVQKKSRCATVNQVVTAVIPVEYKCYVFKQPNKLSTDVKFKCCLEVVCWAF